MQPFQISMNGTGGDNAMGNVTGFRDYSGFGLLEALWDQRGWELFLYLVVFLISLVGNVSVIISLCRKKRQRTITNAFFLNLAISDLLLAIFCMPFSLIENLLQDFIFDEWLCKVIQFVEGISVASSVWTLVALSVERYYVICHPIRSRQWQTMSHARRIISTIWVTGTLLSVPILFFHEIQLTPKGGRICSGNLLINGVYSTLIDIVMFVIPLTILGVTYYFISKTLDIKDSRVQIAQPELSATGIQETSLTENIENPEEGFLQKCQTRTLRLFRGQQRASPDSRNRSGETATIELRQTNLQQHLFKKKKVMKTINMVVLQFSVCWTPRYVMYGITRYYQQLFDNDLGHSIIHFCQLLGYASGCCNPVTYCLLTKCCSNGFNALSRFWTK